MDVALAKRQWQGLKARLEELGVRVVVVPPVADWPGTVYPANAGFMFEVDAPRAASERRFLLANLLPTRAGEQAHYAKALANEGIPTEELDPPLRFEGEADLFPAGDRYLFSHGRLERQRFVPALAWPPWRRVYGFRTDVRVRKVLAPRLAPAEVVRVELVLEAHYHGDTALCAFGPNRELRVLPRDARRRLRPPPRPDPRPRRRAGDGRRVGVPEEGRRVGEVHDRRPRRGGGGGGRARG